MQMSTHFLICILIAKLFSFLTPTFPIAIQIILIAVLAVLSHDLSDCIAISTYHPYKPHKDDVFFMIFHIIYAYALSGFLFIWFFKDYWWVMLFSILPDIIDCYILRALFHKDPIYHRHVDKMRDALFSWLPDLKEKKWAVIFEFIFAGAIGVSIILL